MDASSGALIAFFVVLVIAVGLYLRPELFRRAPRMPVMSCEGFTTIAIDGKSLPKCFLRDAEAQRLLAMFASVPTTEAPSSPAAMALAELTVILQKMLCIDADLAGAGMGPYSTFQLPYMTSHDVEPAANFVGRCLRNSVRSRDIEMVMGTFEQRGNELLTTLCMNSQQLSEARAMFKNIVGRAARNISEYCLKEKASLDTPAGVRDPGYYEPPSLKDLRSYEIVGGGKQWI
jgi:hypothetical protein